MAINRQTEEIEKDEVTKTAAEEKIATHESYSNNKGIAQSYSVQGQRRRFANEFNCKYIHYVCSPDGPLR